MSSNTGREDLAVAVEAAEPLDLADDPLPDRHPGGDDVVRAAWTLDLPGHQVASPGSGRRAQRCEERVRGELLAQRRLRPVTGPYPRLGGIPVEQSADRGEQGRPVASREVGAADASGEEDVPREQLAPDGVRDMRRRVPRHRGDLERHARELQRLVARQPDLGHPRPNVHSGRCEGLRLFEQEPLGLGHMHGGAGRLRQVGDADEVIPVAVRDEDRDADCAVRSRADRGSRPRRRSGRRRAPPVRSREARTT